MFQKSGFQLKIFLLVLLVVSCKQEGILAEDEKKQVIDEVRLMLDNYYSDIRKSGLTAEFKYLDNSPDFFWVPPGYVSAINYDSVKATLNRNAPVLRLIDNGWDTLRIIPLTTMLATYTGKLHSVIWDTAGNTTTYNMQETGLVIKRKDGWKLLSGQTGILP